MKILRNALLVAAACSMGTSCLSLDMIARAEGNPPPNQPHAAPYPPQPAYYALVPAVLPLDLISLPVQYFYFQSARQQNAAPPPPPPPGY
jgi:hypothetical protein